MTCWSTSTHMLLVVDNHDSFTWNLVHLLGQLGVELEVVQGDTIDVRAVHMRDPSGIVLSPGPGRPRASALQLVLEFAGKVPILGVCLGHQVICQAFGATVQHAARVMHGRTSAIVHDRRGLFMELPSPLQVARYHSLIVDAATLPPELEAVAFTAEGELMAVRHRSLPIDGLQFHPESFMTEHGAAMMSRFVAGLPAR